MPPRDATCPDRTGPIVIASGLLLAGCHVALVGLAHLQPQTIIAAIVLLVAILFLAIAARRMLTGGPADVDLLPTPFFQTIGMIHFSTLVAALATAAAALAGWIADSAHAGLLEQAAVVGVLVTAASRIGMALATNLYLMVRQGR